MWWPNFAEGKIKAMPHWACYAVVRASFFDETDCRSASAASRLPYAPSIRRLVTLVVSARSDPALARPIEHCGARAWCVVLRADLTPRIKSGAGSLPFVEVAVYRGFAVWSGVAVVVLRAGSYGDTLLNP